MDLTLCTSTECPQRETCLRAQGKPEPRYQSYSNFEYFCNKNSGFADYIPTVEIVTFNKIDNERHFV